MDGGAVTTRRHIELAGLGLGHTDEVGHAVDAQAARLLRVHDHDIGHTGHQGNGSKVFDGIERHFVVQGLIDAVRTDRAHQQGVTIGGRLGHHIRPQIAPGTGSVLDDEGLAKGFGELGCNSASQDVGSATGRKGNDDLDGAVRPIVLRQHGHGQCHSEGGGGQCEQGVTALVGLCLMHEGLLNCSEKKTAKFPGRPSLCMRRDQSA